MHVPKWLSTTLSFALLGLIFAAYIVTHAPAPALKTESSGLSFNRTISIAGVSLHVAAAATPAQQEQGLSNTAPLLPDQGMLFLFPTPAVVPFWMKDMHYPLDIIWIDADKRVVDVTADLSPSTYPQSFPPKAPAQYVLEVSAGFAQTHGVVIGTPVSF